MSSVSSNQSVVHDEADYEEVYLSRHKDQESPSEERNPSTFPLSSTNEDMEMAGPKKVSNDGVVNPCHLKYDTCKLDILDRSKVGLMGFFGRLGFSCAPYYHPYISNGGSRALILPSWGLLLWWICPLLTNEPL